LDIQPPVVYHWKRRFDALGLLGLATHTQARTPITTQVPVQAMMEVFQRLDNNPLVGHYRVKMALDSLGYWTLEIMHAVWRMPPYRWSQCPQRVLCTRQLSLFDGFAQ
jgi:hypothetical protein